MPQPRVADTLMKESRKHGSGSFGCNYVARLLEEVEAIVEANDVDDLLLEPVPLGLPGVRFRVKEVPPILSGAMLNNELDDEELTLALDTFLGDKRRGACVTQAPSHTRADCQDLRISGTKRELTQISQDSSPAIKKTRCHSNASTKQLLASTKSHLSLPFERSLSSRSALPDHRESEIVKLHPALANQGTGGDSNRFRSYQSGQWNERFQELAEFKLKHGHCLVPHHFPANQHLAQWIKRQRYQYKRKQMNCHSTLTDEREQMLEQLGFVWDSHNCSWHEKLECLKRFKELNGHCSVPSAHTDRSLAIWVKGQRRQFKLYQKGDPRSTMTTQRIAHLDKLGFDWNPRNL